MDGYRGGGADLGSAGPSSPAVVPVCGCSAGMCRASEPPPSAPAEPSAMEQTEPYCYCYYYLYVCVSVCVCSPDVGGEDDEDALGEGLVQQVSGQQAGQAAVALQELLMQPPAQRRAHLLLSKQQGSQQLRKHLQPQENHRG